MNQRQTRRRFLDTAACAGAGLALTSTSAGADEKPALLGGKPVRTGRSPSWPVFDAKEEQELIKVVRSGRWSRGDGRAMRRFEEALGGVLGAKHALATSSGTGALLTSLQALDVQAGDEVLLPSYTFVACVNVVLACNALPVFVDVDPETFQIDPLELEGAITDRTTAMMPVHLGGSVADLDAILSIAGKHGTPVVEDACQSHLAEWRGRKVGTFGRIGCFSFQASKNITSGEGGFLVTDDEALYDRCFSYHWNGRSPRPGAPKRPGCKFMMSEFQAAVLLAQLTRLEEQSKRRSENAEYLSRLLREVPGIAPARMYEGCTRNSYHLYMFRYQSEAFANLPRSTFLKALGAEGVPASGGYQPLHREPFIVDALQSRGFQRLFPSDRIAQWKERNACPKTDRLCAEAVWLTQNTLLGPRSDMDQIAEAVRKVHRHAAELARA